MVSTNIRIMGVKALRKKALKLPAAVRHEVSKALEENAREYEADVRRGVPVGATGRLRDSIVSGEVLGSFGTAWKVTAGGGDAYYGPFVEFGTDAGLPAQPFFYPPYRMKRAKYRSRITRAYNKALKKMSRIKA